MSCSRSAASMPATAAAFRRLPCFCKARRTACPASFDDHIKLLLDVGDAEPVRRDYTPRHFDVRAQELTLEFALHGDGPAAQWAAQAQPGHRATVAGPRGSFIIPMDYDWHLLVGDDTAIPAIARRLEELPSGARGAPRKHRRLSGGMYKPMYAAFERQSAGRRLRASLLPDPSSDQECIWPVQTTKVESAQNYQ